jgi:signal transduction histidine kinase
MIADLEEKVDKLMQTISILGQTTNVSRSYLFEFDLDKNTMSNTHEWLNPLELKTNNNLNGIEPQINNLQNLSIDLFPDWMKILSKGETIIASNIDEYSFFEKTYNILKEQNIKSILVSPLYGEGELHGFVGFDECKTFREWDNDTINFLKTNTQNIEKYIRIKHFNDKLIEEQQKLFTIFNAINEMIYIVDPKSYEILYVNSALEKIFNKKVLGNLCYEVFQGLNEPCSFCTNDIILKNKNEPYHWQHYNKQLNKYFSICDSIIKWPDGRDVRFEMAIDITQIKKAEEETKNALEHSVEQDKLATVGRIAGKMAHDFNNILAIIRGKAELNLLIEKQLNPKMKDFLELIIEQADRGANMTKNLVAFAKDQEVTYSFFHINNKTDLVLDLLRKDIDNLNIRINKEYEHNIPELLADKGMVQHALVNIFQNSIHALSKTTNPNIFVKTYNDNKYIYLDIKDNGCGIPEEYKNAIFEPGVTLKGSKDSLNLYDGNIKGTGYGMANIKKYVELHKGIINLESELNKGTTITLGFPIIRKELTNEEKEELIKKTICKEKRILILEDEQHISNVLYTILSREPYNHIVDIAYNGEMALDFLKRNEYDLVHFDYILPGGINGKEIYDKFRENDKKTPVVFYSGNMEFLESFKKIKQIDNNVDFVSKPCPNIEYVEKVNELLLKK